MPTPSAATSPRAPTNRRAITGLDPFESVVERHGPAVLRFCIARLGPDHGEEAFQETLLAALRHYGELQQAEAVGGWLFSIAARKIIDCARSRAREPIASDRLELTGVVWHDPSPTGAVWSRVAGLPSKQREALALRYIGDLSHADIAAAMGTTEAAARRSVFEGLKRLRRDLAADPDL